MKAKQLLFFIVFFAIANIAKSQEYNPFKSIGKKGKVLTLSKGKYVEFFDTDSIQRIGTVLFNIRTKKIVKLLDANQVYKKASDNSSTSRWWSPDPLADKFASLSPYNFTENNPINMVDPDGRAASPIYDENGSFLGTDDQGFAGAVLFQSKAFYDFQTLGGNITLTHQQALSTSTTIDQALSNNPTQQGVDMVTNAVNDVVAKTEGGFSMSDLHNGKVSSYYYSATSTDKVNAFNNNDGSAVSPKVPAQTSLTADASGQKKMTFNLSPSSLIARADNGKVQGTVENIQNTAIHEKTHLTGNVPGSGTAHAKSYEAQMKHPTFKNVTPEFRKEILDAYKDVKAGKL